MHLPTPPILKYLFAMYSYIFSRPHLDLDIERLDRGYSPIGLSAKQNYPEPIPDEHAVYIFEFLWNFHIRIKNNSTKNAYNIKIEDILLNHNDYLQQMDALASLKENEQIELYYSIRHRDSMTGNQAESSLQGFPYYLDKISILVSYTNEGRRKFYTHFTMDRESKVNEHLLKEPKIKS
jgi:hypothetical protein